MTISKCQDPNTSIPGFNSTILNKLIFNNIHTSGKLAVILVCLFCRRIPCQSSVWRANAGYSWGSTKTANLHRLMVLDVFLSHGLGLLQFQIEASQNWTLRP